jgi:hypothetical protein
MVMKLMVMHNMSRFTTMNHGEYGLHIKYGQHWSMFNELGAW